MSRARSRTRRGPRKDRLIQTRVAQELEKALKSEADRRRLSVSHLIRNVLEDTFDLVDTVVRDVDNIVADSVELADQVRRDAENIAFGSRERVRKAAAERDAGDEGDEESDEEPGETDAPEPAAEGSDPTADIDAWNAVTVNRPADCARCDKTLARGDSAHLGISATAGGPKVWLCQNCLDTLE